MAASYGSDVPGWSPALWAPGGQRGVVLGRPGRVVLGVTYEFPDLLGETGKTELAAPNVKAPAIIQTSGLVRKIAGERLRKAGLQLKRVSEKVDEELALREKKLKESARATARRNMPYLIARTKERELRRAREADCRRAVEEGIPYSETPTGRAIAAVVGAEVVDRGCERRHEEGGPDWGPLVRFVGVTVAMAGGAAAAAALGAGAAAGGGALTVAGAAKAAKDLAGTVKKAAKAAKVGGKVDVSAAIDASGVEAEEAMAVAHELLETEELAELIDAGKSVVKDGIDVTAELRADAAKVQDLLATTGLLAFEGDERAAKSLLAIGEAAQERAEGVVRERTPARKDPLELQGYVQPIGAADRVRLAEAARELLAPAWAVEAEGRIHRLAGDGAPPRRARWIVREGRVVER